MTYQVSTLGHTAFSVVGQGSVLATLVLAPLPAGSTEPSWIALWCSFLAVGLVTAPLGQLTGAHFRRALPVACLFALFVAIVWYQRQPVQLPSGNPVWETAGQLLGGKLDRRVSVTALSVWSALGLPLAMFLGFLACFLHGTDRGAARRFLWAAALANGSYAALAVGDALTLSWAAAPAVPRPLSWPFVNRNHAASFYGIGAVIWILLVLSAAEESARDRGGSLSEVGIALLHERPWLAGGSILAIVSCLTAMFLTLSRAGILISLAATGVVGGILVSRMLAGQRRAPLVAGAGVLAAALALELWGGGIAYRVGMEGLTDASRSQVYSATFEIMGDAPFGTGFGTFEEVFPRYRPSSISTVNVWDFAHSTPLELAAELGLPFALPAVLAWVLAVAALTRGAITRRRDNMFPLASLAALLIGTMHSIVDFPIQIAGYGIVWAGLVGTGLAQTVSRSLQQGRRACPLSAF